MCRIISVSNQKGGCAKTTTSINLGVGLTRLGQRVLLVDADPQGHLTLGLGFQRNLKVTLTILTVLVGSKCKQNLDLFLVSVVNIVAKMLESPLNTEIIEQISSTVSD